MFNIMLQNKNYILSDYHAVYMQFCMNNSLHVAFVKTVLLECINERYKVYCCALSYNDCSTRVYRLFTTIFHKLNA